MDGMSFGFALLLVGTLAFVIYVVTGSVVAFVLGIMGLLLVTGFQWWAHYGDRSFYGIRR